MIQLITIPPTRRSRNISGSFLSGRACRFCVDRSDDPFPGGDLACIPFALLGGLLEPLTPVEIEEIVHTSAARLQLSIDPEAARLVSRYTCEGRRAVNLLVDAYGRALYEQQHRRGRKGLRISAALMQKVLISNRLFPLSPVSAGGEAVIGRALALGVSGFTGLVLEIEALAFPAGQPGRGSMRFNETAGSMARDSVFVAASLLRKLSGVDLKDYDLHLNVVGGGNIDGPSAGAAIFLAIYSAVK